LGKISDLEEVDKRRLGFVKQQRRGCPKIDQRLGRLVFVQIFIRLSPSFVFAKARKHLVIWKQLENIILF
jgi:hypothetical protein